MIARSSLIDDDVSAEGLNEMLATGALQPQAWTGRAYRSVTFSTKHPVVVRRDSYVYEPLCSSGEVVATVYEVRLRNACSGSSAPEPVDTRSEEA